MTETESSVKELESTALSLPEEARALVICDQVSLNYAGEKLQAVAQLRRKIQDHHAPIKKAQYDAWKITCAAEAKLLEPVAEAEKILRGSTSAYLHEQEQIRLREERARREEAERIRREQEAEARRLQEEANRKHEEEIEQQVEFAEKAGATAEEVEAIIERPAPIIAPLPAPYMPPPTVAPTVEAPKGISQRVIWSAEITSVKQLAAEVAAGRQPEGLLLPNMVALNKLAGALKGALLIPGVRAVQKAIVAVRG